MQVLWPYLFSPWFGNPKKKNCIITILAAMIWQNWKKNIQHISSKHLPISVKNLIHDITFSNFIHNSWKWWKIKNLIVSLSNEYNLISTILKYVLHKKRIKSAQICKKIINFRVNQHHIIIFALNYSNSIMGNNFHFKCN